MKTKALRKDTKTKLTDVNPSWRLLLVFSLLIASTQHVTVMGASHFWVLY